VFAALICVRFVGGGTTSDPAAPESRCVFDRLFGSPMVTNTRGFFCGRRCCFVRRGDPRYSHQFARPESGDRWADILRPSLLPPPLDEQRRYHGSVRPGAFSRECRRRQPACPRWWTPPLMTHGCEEERCRRTHIGRCRGDGPSLDGTGQRGASGARRAPLAPGDPPNDRESRSSVLMKRSAKRHPGHCHPVGRAQAYEAQHRDQDGVAGDGLRA